MTNPKPTEGAATMTDLTAEKIAELRRLASECLASIGPAGSSTVPFVRALRAYQEEALPEVILSLLDALAAAQRELAQIRYDNRFRMGSREMRCSICKYTDRLM